MNLWRKIRTLKSSSQAPESFAPLEAELSLSQALSGLSLDTQALQPHPILSLIPTRALARLLAEPAVSEYPKGTVVFEAGAPCDAIYLIVSGRCESRVRGDNGVQVVEEVFGPGDTLGERALLTYESHRTTVTVVTHSVLLRLPSEDLRGLFADDPSIAGRFAETINAHRPRTVRSAAERGDVRRIVTVLSLSSRIDTPQVLDLMAAALHRITLKRVLLIHLSADPEAASLADWAIPKRKVSSEFFFKKHLREYGRGISELRLAAGTDLANAASIAPLLGHCGRHYEFVLVDLAVGIPGTLCCEALIQADLAYVFLQSSVQNLYDFQLLSRELAERTRGNCLHLKPILFAEDQDAAADTQSSLKQLGYPLHSFARGFPLSENGGSGDHRFELHVNRLAREIARCRIGLALSSGGAKGLAHVGVIQVLEENGIEIDCIAGASMGAYIGALWAYGMDGSMLEKISREHESRWGLWSLLDPVLPPRRGFLRAGRIVRRLRRTIGEAHFSELIRPLRVVATHLDTLERVVFASGDVANSVSASIAIPGVCVPVALDGEDYIDGGIADPLPVDVLQEMGIEQIIAVNVIPPPERLRKWREVAREAGGVAAPRGGFLGRFLNAQINYFAEGNILHTMLQAVNGAQTRVAEASATHADVLLRPLACDAVWHDFTNPGKYITLGRQAALEALPALRALVQPHENQPSPPLAIASRVRAA